MDLLVVLGDIAGNKLRCKHVKRVLFIHKLLLNNYKQLLNVRAHCINGLNVPCLLIYLLNFVSLVGSKLASELVG